MTQEIKETNWDLFCKRFEEAHRGTLIGLESIKHDGQRTPLARQAALRTFRFEKTEDCNDIILIEAGEAPAPLVQHRIVGPIHVRVREEGGSQKLLQIDAETGSVEIRFSSGKISGILKDLEMV